MSQNNPLENETPFMRQIVHNVLVPLEMSKRITGKMNYIKENIIYNGIQQTIFMILVYVLNSFSRLVNRK